MRSQRLIQITDLHFREEPGDILCSGVVTDDSLRRVLDEILRREGPDVRVLVTGDLTQDPVESAYRRLREVLADYPFRFVCLPGNHDDAMLMRSVLATPNLTTDSTTSLGAWTLITLDSAVAGSPGGRLGGEEIARLRAALAAVRTDYVGLALHHQPVTVRSPWMDRMALADSAALFEVVRFDERIKLVVFGHVHQEIDEWRGQARLLGTPSTCVQFAPRTLTMSLDGLPPAYRWIDLGAEGRVDTGVVYLEDLRLLASV